MSRFALALISTIILAQAPAFGQGIPMPDLRPSTHVTGFVDVGNRSDTCVRVAVAQVSHPNQRFTLEPGVTKHILLYFTGDPTKVYADITANEKCPSSIIVRRYDYVPYNGKSQLTIHKQGNTYIMRHGP